MEEEEGANSFAAPNPHFPTVTAASHFPSQSELSECNTADGDGLLIRHHIVLLYSLWRRLMCE